VLRRERGYGDRREGGVQLLELSKTVMGQAPRGGSPLLHVTLRKGGVISGRYIRLYLS
jgi:hypothetical protein